MPTIGGPGGYVLGADNAAAAPPGTVFVANFGGGGSTGVQATGSVTSYHSGAKGNAAALQTIADEDQRSSGGRF